MPDKPLSFRWSYIALPVAVLALSIVLTAYFYHLLPAEVAYSFRPGSPDRWTGRSAVIGWTLAPQFFLVLLAAAIAWGVTRLSRRFSRAEGAATPPKRVLSLMGNMVALPQLVLAFAMLDIFLYNAYQTHLMPLWAFALIIMGLGGVYLAMFFIQALKRAGEMGKGRR